MFSVKTNYTFRTLNEAKFYRKVAIFSADFLKDENENVTYYYTFSLFKRGQLFIILKYLFYSKTFHRCLRSIPNIVRQSHFFRTSNVKANYKLLIPIS